MAVLATMLASTFVYHCTSPLVAAFCYMTFLEGRDGRPRHNADLHLRLPLHLPASGSFLLHVFFYWKVAMAALATKLPSTFVYHCTSPLVAAFAHEQALDSRGPC